MNSKKELRNAVILSLLILTEIFLASIFIKVVYVPKEINGIKIYPQKVSTRSLVSSKNFSLMWNKETEDGNQQIVYTQLFSPDEENIIYVDENSLNALDYFTGSLQWSKTTPVNSKFHLYVDKLYSLAVYDELIPFAPEENFIIPTDCNSDDASTMHVYNPHNGQKVWEYSYRMAKPDTISFKGDSAFIYGLTISQSGKYISELEINIETGKVLRVSCRNYNDYNYSNEKKTEGSLSSNFYPVFDDLSGKLNVGNPTFVVEGARLIMVDNEDERPIGFIEFSGSELNPYDVQMVIQNDLLVIYLDDSNQFFVFRME